MNCKSASLTLALIGALTLGIVGCGSANNNQQQPAPGTTGGLPPQPPYTTAQPTTTGGSMAQPATNGKVGATGMSPGFDDAAGSKGYITQQDAERIPWLQSHFAQCDANGDGRVTREEYGQCSQGPATQGTMQPPPQGASTSG